MYCLISYDLGMTPCQNAVEKWVRIPRFFIDPQFWSDWSGKINLANFSFCSLKRIKIVNQWKFSEFLRIRLFQVKWIQRIILDNQNPKKFEVPQWNISLNDSGIQVTLFWAEKCSPAMDSTQGIDPKAVIACPIKSNASQKDIKLPTTRFSHCRLWLMNSKSAFLYLFEVRKALFVTKICP